VTQASPAIAPPAAEELRLLDAYWRAANYVSVGQIYLLDNPLLREPLAAEHVKPRLLGHWGTTPGLNFLYVHLNRAIRERDLDAIYICGPGHGGPAVVANAYLEGTYGELYTHVGSDEEGLRQLFASSRSPAGSRATRRRRRPARSTRAASSGMRSCTPRARRSTTRTCSSPA
jgi:xylulose-5-phosphate/fructose-6-phosphate phosphoketolase